MLCRIDRLARKTANHNADARTKEHAPCRLRKLTIAVAEALIKEPDNRAHCEPAQDRSRLPASAFPHAPLETRNRRDGNAVIRYRYGVMEEPTDSAGDDLLIRQRYAHIPISFGRLKQRGGRLLGTG